MERKQHPKGSISAVTTAIIDAKVFRLTNDEIEACVMGIIELDRTGTIVSYNDAEARLARGSAQAAIGKNFFTELAPCTAVREFQGRFIDLIDAGGTFCQRFSFIFHFLWGDRKVWVSMVGRLEEPGRLYLVVDAVTVAA